MPTLGQALPTDADIQKQRDVSSRNPVNISSQELNFDRLQDLTWFKGKVKAVHGKVTLTADEMKAIADNREATALGHVCVTDSQSAVTLTCGNMEYLDLMQTMTAHDHPQMTTLDDHGLPVTLLGRQMEMDSTKNTVTVNQNVQILHQKDLAEAQRATFYTKENKVVLEDSPQITLPNAVLSGQKITTTLGGDQMVFVEGLADAVFYPAGAKDSSNPGPETLTDKKKPQPPGKPLGTSTITNSKEN